MTQDNELIGYGRFSGRGGHTLVGAFTLRPHRDGVLMETSADFYFDGSLAPGWALMAGIPRDHKDPKVQEAARVTCFGRLPGGVNEVRGIQRGIIPPALDVGRYGALFLWCFGAPYLLGVGRIEHKAGRGIT